MQSVAADLNPKYTNLCQALVHFNNGELETSKL